MKLKERRNLIGKRNMCLSFRCCRRSTTTQGSGKKVGIQNHLWTTQKYSWNPFKREMENLVTMFNGVKSLTVVVQLSILDVWRVPG